MAENLYAYSQHKMSIPYIDDYLGAALSTTNTLLSVLLLNTLSTWLARQLRQLTLHFSITSNPIIAV